MGKIIDLHIHSNLSDGVLSPKEIIDEAVQNGLSVISISDHDTIEAYNDELYEYAKNKNIQLINGVEISTKSEKSSFHILGYNFDINNEKLKEKLFLSRNSRHQYLYDVSEKLKEIGYVLDVEGLDKIKSVTKSHIALDIINNLQNETLLLQKFNHIPGKGEFIEKTMNKGCPAYVRKSSITPIEAVKLIRNAGGKAVLAHPVAYKYQNHLAEDDILDLINEIKPDGIESNYIYIDCNNNKINEIKKWNKVAREYNLITTIGSDFHNKDGIHPLIGLINEDLELNDNYINNIINDLLN